MDEILTLKQCADEVGLAQVTMRAYADPNSNLKPKLKTFTVGRAKVVTRADFEAWKADHRSKPPKK